MIRIEISKALYAEGGSMQLNLKLSLKKGQLVTLYGPSGAGKTTTLKILAGLLKPDTGTIEAAGNPWYDSGRALHLPPQKRNVGFVFQDYALFPHMTVLENLEFARGKGTGRELLRRLIGMTGLEGLQDRKPGQLSGGQQQRVALARALVRQPELLLLDEPLAALDLENRLRLQDSLLELHREFGLTTLLVSHDESEIMKLSDHVFHIEEGKILREGAPAELFFERNISGKFQFTGEVLAIVREEVVWIVTVRIQNHVVKVIASEEDINGLEVGHRVLVAAKAFNPILYRIP